VGLATVYGIVKQSGGFHLGVLRVRSRRNLQGLPAKGDEPAEAAAAPTATVELPRGTETVLVVEDAASVRMGPGRCSSVWLHVLEAPNGDTALHLAAKHHGPSIVADGCRHARVSGRQLAEQLAQLRPDMKVLYASGYADRAIVHHGILESGIAYLPKPFTPRHSGEECGRSWIHRRPRSAAWQEFRDG